MPSTGWGIGAAKGVENFLASYYQAKSFEQQERQSKYEPVLRMIMTQIQDDDLSFDERARLIDTIPEITGIKLPGGTTLSKQLQLDKLNDTLISTGQKTEGQLPIARNNLELTPNGATARSEIVQEGKLPEDIRKRRGELTPNDLKSIRGLQEREAIGKQELARQRELIKLRNEADIRELETKGFKELGNFYDEVKKRWFTAFGNPTTGAEQRLYFPEGAKPEKVVIQETRNASGGSSSSKLGQLTRAQNVVDNYNRDSTSVPYSDYIAAKNFLEDFEKTGRVKEAQATIAGQTASGTRLIQPSQREGFNRQDRDDERLEQNRIEDLEIKLTEAEADIPRYETEATAALESKTRLNRLYNDIKRNKNAEPADVERAKDDSEKADRAYSVAFGKLQDAHTRKNRIQSIIENRKSSTKSVRSNNNDDDNDPVLNEPRNAALIQQFRNLNPNNNWTRREIFDFLKRAKQNRRR